MTFSAGSVTSPPACHVEQLEDGLVLLENDRLRFLLDPEQAGGAISIMDKLIGKQVGVCQGYGSRRHPALIEALAGQRVKEGRVDALPLPYAIIAMNVDDAGVASVTFRGHPVAQPEPGQADDAAPLHRVRVDKTCRLAPGEPMLRVELALTNEAERAMPLAAWISNGVRITDEDVDIYAPTPTGTTVMEMLWHAPMSVYVNVPRATAGWTAAVARNDARTGLFLAATDEQVDAVWNWLGKFPGFTLGFGTPQVTLAPGETLRVPYVLGTLQGLPRVDGASSAFVGAIDTDDQNVAAGQSRRVTVSVTAPMADEARVSLALKYLGDSKKVSELGSQTLALQPGLASEAAFDVTYEADDTCVLIATVRSTAGDASETLHMERPVTVGVPQRLYRRPLAKLAGRRYWGRRVGERPLQPRTQRCNRNVKHPMIPWLTPTAQRRLKVLFVGEVSFNTAVYRDLARRGDYEWDFVNVWGTGDMLSGPYGEAEINRARSKLRRFKPDCVLTAGLRYDDVPPPFIEDLWQFAQRGGGLVIVGRDDPQHHSIWAGRLGTAHTPLEAVDLAAPLRGLFDADVAPDPSGTLRSYVVGSGRVVQIDKQLDWRVLGTYGDPGPRNDLLPRYRGKTRLPDWEYHFAQYLQVIRHAARIIPEIVLGKLTLGHKSLHIDYQSDAARRVGIEYELVSTDRLRALRGQGNVDLDEGAGSVRLDLSPLPANEYVIHAWVLDGPIANPETLHGSDDALLLRGSHERPVIDFAADCQTLGSAVSIEHIDVAGERKAVPDAVTVSVAGDAALLRRAELEVQWHHGGHGRVVWSRREPLAGRSEHRFEGIAFEPVSHEGGVAVRLWAEGQVVAERGQRFEAWKPGNVADDEMAFLTAAGGEHDWYGTRMMQDWAEREAGFDFTYLRYGMKGGGFPWKRGKNHKLDPPIVNEQALRDLLAPQFEREFNELGHAYVNMCDEFLLGGEYDWSEPTLKAYRKHLASRYGSIAKLNAQWDTRYASFSEAMPVLLDEARERADNPSQWIDFRLFMDSRVNRRYEIASEEATKVSPLLRVGDSGAYAPGVGVGINYYTMVQASRFTMTYGGLRSDWVRSFLKPDDVVGVWLGYGRANPIEPWAALFRRYNILAWWGYLLHKRLTAHTNMSAIHMDLTPAPPFRQIGREQHEIRAGLGKLMLHAKLAEARAVIAYSQASVYANEVIHESHEQGANAATVLLGERNIAYRFVADEQVQAGALAETGAAVFVLPNVDAMPTDAARHYADAIARGRFALADVAAATRDEHGRRLRESPLDEAFGVDRSRGELLAAKRFEPILWTKHAPKALRSSSGQMVPAMRGLLAADERVWARFQSGEPAIIAAPTPGGSLAVMLNTRLPWVSSNKVEQALNPEDRPDELSPNQTVGRLFDHLLERASLTPYAQVTSDAVRPKMISRFDDDQARYFGLLLDEQRGRMTVTLPQTAHTYDVRAGKYLGLTARFEADVKPSQLAKVYAQLPYAVSAVRVQVTPKRARPGEVVTIIGRLKAEDDAAVTQFHVVHATVIDPAGSRLRIYERNLSVSGGQFELRIPLALNAPTGGWQVELRDVATGKRRKVRFEVVAKGNDE